MKRTMAWPPVVEHGRARMTADPDDPAADDRGEALRQIIRLNVMDGGNANPFNPPIGVDSIVFKRGQERDLSVMRSQVAERFRTLERQRRARLVDVVIDKAEGAVMVRVTYEDLETQRRENLEVPFA